MLFSGYVVQSRHNNMPADPRALHLHAILCSEALVQMRNLDRYLLREMFVPFMIGQAAIVLLLTGSVLYNNADVILVNRVPLQFVVRMVLYFIPFLVHMTMPVAMAVGASLAVSKLAAGSEITVMRASGISLTRIFAPIIALGLLISVGDFFFGEYAVPAASERFQEVLNEIPTHLPTIQPQSGVWITASDQSYVIFVRTITQHPGYLGLSGVEIASSPSAAYNKEADSLVIFAREGTYANGVWTLKDYGAFHHGENNADWQKIPQTPDGVFRLNISVDPQVFQKGFLLQLPMWKMAGSTTRTFSQLKDTVAHNQLEHINDVFLLLDYYFKLSIPFSCLAMAVCCPPMALKFARGGGFMGTLLSICLDFVYWNTMLLMRILGSPSGAAQTAILPPLAAAWGQNVLFSLLGIWVMRRSD